MTESSRRFGDLLVELGFVTDRQVREALALQPLTGARVGEALMSLGYLTRAQLQRALAAAIQRGDQLVLDKPPLGEILVGLQYLDESKLGEALEVQKQDGRRLGEVLVDLGAVGHQQVYEALELQHRMGRQYQPPPPIPAPGSPTPGRRVMVVDDSPLSCALVQEGLTARGYEVLSFTDPFAALEQLDLVRPDLVLTDLDMPGLDGAELCRRLKEGPGAALPVIILTANDADALRVSGLRAGAEDYVNKGASMDELAARIEGILKRATAAERVRRLFARYTSDAVVEEVLKTGNVVLTGEKREVTVLFADLRNFTGLAESMAPEAVMTALNEILGGLADAVLGWGGTLDKFLGDGLMAFWGAPMRRDDDTEAAVSAALQMMELVKERNLRHLGEPPMELGIGLNTGLVIAGSLGSQRRTEYTCIGDTVNVASRLCALAGAGEILLGEGTAHKLAPLAALESLPPVRVKGRQQPVPLHRVTPALQTALESLRRF